MGVWFTAINDALVLSLTLVEPMSAAYLQM